MSREKIFYTALYHSLQMPTLFNDVNGDYTGFDKKVHKTDNFRYFTDLSLWDTFRTIHPLFTSYCSGRSAGYDGLSGQNVRTGRRSAEMAFRMRLYRIDAWSLG